MGGILKLKKINKLKSIYNEIKEYKGEISMYELLKKYFSPIENIKMQRDFYRSKSQLDYLIQHTDITTLKPATGYLRKKQLDLVEFALDFFEYIEEIDIKPFLICGNLIGAVRHNGFIPWDDDLDFGLIRNDYEKLISFCKKNCIVEIYNGNWNDYTTDKHMERMDKLVKNNPNEYILDIWVDQIQIMKGTSCIDRLTIDFWAFDYYKDNYLVEEHNKYLDYLEREKQKINKVSCIVDFLREEIKKNENISKVPTEKIQPGIDNVIGYLLYKKGRDWINASDLFPLKKTKYEKEEFLMPNNPKNILLYQYSDYMEFPKEFGIYPHERYKEKYILKSLPTVEFYIIDAFEIYHFLPLYHIFEKNSIYAKFVVEPIEINTSGVWFDYDNALKILDINGVRYSKHCNTGCEYAFTTQEVGILKKYKNKKIHLSYGFSLTTYSFCESDKSISGFDYKLVHGELSMELFERKVKHTKLIKVGYPKHMKICEVRYLDNKNIDTNFLNVENKPILMYFPTWNSASSIQWYADEINKLKEKYFVISKAHHCTYRLESEKENMETLKRISDIVLAENFEFEKASLLGKVAICDAVSGAATEVPFINEDVHLILLYSPLKEKNKFKTIINGFAVCVSKPSELEDAVYMDMDKISLIKKKRKKLLLKAYGNNEKSELNELIKVLKKDSKYVDKQKGC